MNFLKYIAVLIFCLLSTNCIAQNPTISLESFYKQKSEPSLVNVLSFKVRNKSEAQAAKLKFAIFKDDVSIISGYSKFFNLKKGSNAFIADYFKETLGPLQYDCCEPYIGQIPDEYWTLDSGNYRGEIQIVNEKNEFISAKEVFYLDVKDKEAKKEKAKIKNKTPKKPTTNTTNTTNTNTPIEKTNLTYEAIASGETSGYIGDLIITNNTKQSIDIKVGPYLIPPTETTQGYIVPDEQVYSIQANSAITHRMTGYCINIERPPVTAGEYFVPFETWIDESKMQSKWINQYTQNGIVPSYLSPKANIDLTTLKIPGTSTNFPYTIDIDQQAAQGAPLLLQSINKIIELYDFLYEYFYITTPFSYDIEKQKQAIIQHTFWIYTSNLQNQKYELKNLEKLVRQQETTKEWLSLNKKTPKEETLNNEIWEWWRVFEHLGETAQVFAIGKQTGLSQSAYYAIKDSLKKNMTPSQRANVDNVNGGNQYDIPQAHAGIDDIWKDIELTGPTIKWKPAKKLWPYYVAGAAVVGGAAIAAIVLSGNNNGDECDNCDDNNPCTEDSCINGECVNAIIICNDNNSCTTDECVSGNCVYTLIPNCCNGNGNCDDGDNCTIDECINGECVNTPIVCNDDNLCTVDSCDENGNCIFTALICDDGNPCTDDSCVDGDCVFITILCNDGDPCTSDECVNGDCVYTPIICDDEDLCTTDTCVNGECIFTPINCDDGDPCTEDVCFDGFCNHYPIVCEDDGDPCTEEVCIDGDCISNPIICDDGDDCTTDACVNGECIFTPIPCDDGDPCTNDTCVNGECIFTPIVCDDDNLCTTDTCVNGECIYTNIDCDDGDPCTNDSCANGECINTPIVCDDNNPCTTDTCVNGECVFDAVGCNDDDPCTIDSCDENGNCIFTPIICNDDDPCTEDTCINGDCIFTLIVCDDENPCTTDECINGDCVFTQIPCDDGDPCTIDSCDENGNCTFTEIICDDENPCTFDTCIDGECVFIEIVCDDGDPCTTDVCDPELGCVSTPIPNCCTGNEDCTDEDLCTFDTCVAGQCISVPIFCDDGNDCTTDTCDPVLGCIFLPIEGCCEGAEDCDDGDPCTNDFCNTDDGICLNVPIECDDDDPCTEDVCIDGDCTFTPIVCDDDDPCTEDVCIDGDCTFTPIVCDDDNPCTIDTCVDGECFFLELDCNDNDPCTEDVCLDGECTNTPIVCDDDDPCTEDTCEDGECIFTPIVCDDDDPCTEDTCEDGECIFTPIEGCCDGPKDCDDGDPCTNDFCADGDCLNLPIQCNDDDPCTEDSCVDGECVFTPIVCDDEDPCTEDTCVDGECIFTPILEVDLSFEEANEGETDGSITVEITEASNFDNFIIQLSDDNGLVDEYEGENNPYTFENLAAGDYFIEVYDDNNCYSDIINITIEELGVLPPTAKAPQFQYPLFSLNDQTYLQGLHRFSTYVPIYGPSEYPDQEGEIVNWLYYPQNSFAANIQWSNDQAIQWESNFNTSSGRATYQNATGDYQSQYQAYMLSLAIKYQPKSLPYLKSGVQNAWINTSTTLQSNGQTIYRNENNQYSEILPYIATGYQFDLGGRLIIQTETGVFIQKDKFILPRIQLLMNIKN